MQTYQTPIEASSTLVSIILEQAAIDGISLTEFERKLLSSKETDSSPTEDEVETFDDEQGEEFWDRIASLIKNAKKRLRRDGGRDEEREFKTCIEMAAGQNGYLAEILLLRGFVRLGGGSRWKSAMHIAGASVVGSAVFLYGLFCLVDHNPGPWLEAHTKPLNKAGDWISVHTLWMSRPDGWFQQYAGYIFFAALFAYAIYAYGCMLRDNFRR